MSDGEGRRRIGSEDLPAERRADLRAIYQATQDARLDSRGRIWDTMKISATLVAGLLVVAGAAYVRKDGIAPNLLAWFGGSLMVVGIGTGIWNFFNALEEQREQAKAEFTLFQIERLLGLHDEISPSDRWPNPQSKYPYMFHASHMGAKVTAPFYEGVFDAPTVYALNRSRDWRGSRWRIAAASALLGFSPAITGGLLLWAAFGSRAIDVSDDLRNLKTLSGVIDRVETSDAAIHAELMALARKIAESSAVRKGTSQDRSDK